MNIFKKIFLIQMIFAAMAIQVTGWQTLTILSDRRLSIDLIFGFPLPFLDTNGLDDGAPGLYPQPMYSAEDFPGEPPHYYSDSPCPSAISARLFCPPQNLPNDSKIAHSLYAPDSYEQYDYIRRIKRRGVFLWEHLRHRNDWQGFTETVSDYPYEVGVSGIRLNSHTYPLPEKVYINFSLNPGYPITEVTKIESAIQKLRKIEYPPFRCILFDLFYIFIVFIGCRYLSKDLFFINSRFTWPFFIIATQVFIIVGLVYYILNIHHIRMDIGWFYQILYLTNCVTVFVMIYCYGKWLLQGAYRFMKTSTCGITT